MLHYLYYRIRYREEFRNQKGITSFGGYCLSSLLDRTLRLAKKIREEIKQLLRKKTDLKHEETELLKFVILENDEFYGLKRRIRTESLLLTVLVLAEFGLNYFTTFIIFSDDKVGLMWIGIRLAIALGVTVMAIVSCERFLEEALPKERHKSDKPAAKISWTVMLLWFICLVAIEWAIYFFGLIRAHDFEGAGVGGDVVKAMIILSMVIPIVAGGIGWDMSRFLDAYNNRKRHDQIQRDLNRINTRMDLLKVRENTTFQKECGDYWHTYNVFKTYKENYNVKNNIPSEEMGMHPFLKDFDTFKTEGLKQYKSQIEQIAPL